MVELSVIIPYYNTEVEYFERCLASLGTSGIAERIEAVVVDDGSAPEAHEAACQACEVARARYGMRVRMLAQQPNRGQNGARQMGLDAAEGTYALFLDSDDLVDGPALASALDCAMERRPPILAFNLDIVDPAGDTLDRYDTWEPGCREMDLHRGIIESHSLCRALYEVSALRGLGFGLVQGPRIGEDTASALSILVMTGRALTLGVTPYHYVQRPTSAMHALAADPAHVADIVRAFDAAIEIMGSHADPWHDEVEWMAIFHVVCEGGRRAVEACGPDPQLRDMFLGWMDSRFPGWHGNPIAKSEAHRLGVNRRLMLLAHGWWRAYAAWHRLAGLSLRERAALGHAGSGSR